MKYIYQLDNNGRMACVLAEEGVDIRREISLCDNGTDWSDAVVVRLASVPENSISRILALEK